MARLVLQNIHKMFDDVHVIRGVDLVAEDHEFVVLIGPSGCGKSTLLRLIAGLEELTDGVITLDGSRIDEVQSSRRGMAMVFQSYALYPHMSVFDNMAFALNMLKVPRQEIVSKVSRVAQTLQLESLLNRKPRQLSGGQRQRVAIGRAIVRSPKVFLFDEPLSNLDASLRVQMRLEISRLHRELGATMVYVTHDQTEAMTLADKIAIMDAGVIVQMGSPWELYRRPASQFVAAFIGSPKMNMLNGIVAERSGDRILVKIENCRLLLDTNSLDMRVGDEVVLGIRPEHVVIRSPGKELDGIEGEIFATERLGSESYLYVKSGGLGEITVRQEGQTRAVAGDKIDLRLPPEDCHLFAKAGHSIRTLHDPA